MTTDVNANFQVLLDKVAVLETKLTNIGVEAVHGLPTVRFTGVNVQAVNGATCSSRLVARINSN